MQPKLYAKILLGTAFVVLLTAFLLNFLIDPYDVFQLRLLPQYGQLQERFLKIEYLKAHTNFDAVVLGSSRVGTVATEDVERLMGVRKAYNFTVSQGNEWYNLQHVRWLVHHQPGLKQLFIQVDFPVSAGPPSSDNLSNTPHPEVMGESRWGFYRKFLFTFSYEFLRYKLSRNSGDDDMYDYHLDRGYWSRPKRDARLEADCQAYVRSEGSLSKRGSQAGPSLLKLRQVDENLRDLAETLKIAAARGIKVTCFTSPFHQNMLDGFNADDFAYFIESLAAVTPYHNFAYYNSVTTNSCNYYEHSHYRRVVGTKVFERLSGAGDDGFGRLVTSDTAKAEVKRVLVNFAESRKSK